MSLMMSGDKGISAFPDGDTLLTWVATVTGPDDSVYEGMSATKSSKTSYLELFFSRFYDSTSNSIYSFIIIQVSNTNYG